MTDKNNYGELGSTPTYQYWNGWVSGSMSLMQQQMLLWTGMFQRLLTGQSSPPQYAQLTVNTWLQMVANTQKLFAYPFEWWTRYMADVPSIVFIMDDTAEQSASFGVVTPYNVPSTATIVTTDLARMGGEGSIPKDYLDPKIMLSGNRLEVRLVNLGEFRMKAAMGNKRTDGTFVGLVYSNEDPSTRPLAIVVVHMTAAAQPLKADAGAEGGGSAR